MEIDNVRIPTRFYKEVATHVIANLIAEKQQTKERSNIPLLLGIHGRSGDGKSFQIGRILEELGYTIFHISGSQLESENAGEPGRLINDTYKEAGSFIREESKGAAIVIDDIDAGFGLWGDMYQYTVNTQIVIATLMHLADNPKRIGKNPVTRVPIILTGNDFTKIYEPISRPGRMRSFLWVPTSEEKIEILTPIFPLLNQEDLNELVSRFSGEPVAFFINLSSYILQEKIWKHFEVNRHQMVSRLFTGHIPSIEYHCLMSEILEVGERVSFHSKYVNHLNKLD